MNHPAAPLSRDFRKAPTSCRVSNINAPPLMGGDKGEGEQTFYPPHLTSPIPEGGIYDKGEELYGNPVAPLSRDFRKAPTSYRRSSI